MEELKLQHSERVAIARLHALLELLPVALDKQLAPTDLTSFEFTLLEKLTEADGHRLRLSDLAFKTNATLPRLSRVVTSLERKGFVVRTPCAEDGRATNAMLTDEGLSAYQDAKPQYVHAVRSLILEDLDAADIDQLSSLSYAILKRLDSDKRLAILTDPSALPEQAQIVGECPADPMPTTPCPADPTHS